MPRQAIGVPCSCKVSMALLPGAVGLEDYTEKLGGTVLASCIDSAMEWSSWWLTLSTCWGSKSGRLPTALSGQTRPLTWFCRRAELLAGISTQWYCYRVKLSRPRSEHWLP